MVIADDVYGSTYNWFYMGTPSTSSYPDNFTENEDVNWQ
jgi:hypothetical protein